MLAISAMAGCTGAPQPRHATPQGAGDPTSPAGSDERGLHLERGRLGFDHALQVRRSRTGVSHELHDGDAVMTGDRMRASIQTSEDAYLYLAFCAHQELAVYPTQGGIRTRAGEVMAAPQAGTELVFDGDPGPEVLYVILSRTEISVADPRLAAALAAQRPSNTPVDCGTGFEAKLVKPPNNAGSAGPTAPHSTNVLRGAVRRKKPISSTRAPDGHNPPPDPDFERFPPDPDFERNPGAIVWYRVDGATGPADVVAADDDGIAVVRHAFRHVPPP
jgi:hypothetical protein